MIETIEGKTNRNLTEDQWKLVLAIKETHDESLWDTFQSYWKERCDNIALLSDYESWEVLEVYAREMFDRADWYRMRDYMNKAFYEGRNLSARDMAEMYLCAISLMQVRFDTPEPITIHGYPVADLEFAAELMNSAGLTLDDLRKCIDNLQYAAKIVYDDLHKTMTESVHKIVDQYHVMVVINTLEEK